MKTLREPQIKRIISESIKRLINEDYREYCDDFEKFGPPPSYLGEKTIYDWDECEKHWKHFHTHRKLNLLIKYRNLVKEFKGVFDLSHITIDEFIDINKMAIALLEYWHSDPYNDYVDRDYALRMSIITILGQQPMEENDDTINDARKTWEGHLGLPNSKLCFNTDEVIEDYRKRGFDLSKLSIDDWRDIQRRTINFCIARGIGPYGREGFRLSVNRFKTFLYKFIDEWIKEKGINGEDKNYM